MILMINLILGLLPYINNFSNIGGFVLGFLLGVLILFKPSLDKFYRNKGGLFEFDAKHSVKQRMKLDKPVQRGASLLIFALLVVGATIGVQHNINVNKYCSWRHYCDCIPCKWWSCSDVTFHCEKMVSSDHLMISCLNNGRSRVFPFANISQPRFQDLCYLICCDDTSCLCPQTNWSSCCRSTMNHGSNLFCNVSSASTLDSEEHLVKE